MAIHRLILHSATTAAALSLLFSLQGANAKKEKCASVPYSNPVIANDCPDPTVIDDRERTGFFYAYSTQDGANGEAGTRYLPVFRSKDFVNWEYAADGFGPGRPQWSEGAHLWAPDINYFDGKYVLYYAMGVWGDSARSASGAAVSDSPTGPFQDRGMVVSKESTGVGNSIDPDLFIDDDGKKYLFWGSLGKDSGIWGVELSDDGLSIRQGTEMVRIGASNMEGSYVKKHGKYYYLFTSKGSCCEGARSSYHIIVSKSKSPLGPYEGPDGKSLTDDSYDNTIMSSSPDKVYVGTGHNSQIITDDSGQDWMAYHAYWKGNCYNGRCLNIDRIFWDKGWPHFSTGFPSAQGDGPEWRTER